MAALDERDERFRGESFNIVRPLVVVGVAGAVALAIWMFAHDKSGVRRQPTLPPLIAIQPPPPPPPPPPPKEEPPEPQKTIEVPQPKPQAAPQQGPKQITINGPAQAGGDAFNIGAGSGGGDVASGGLDANSDFARTSYRQQMRSVLQRLLDQDNRVNRLIFTAEIAIWVDGAGRVSRASVLKSSGDSKADATMVADFQDSAAFGGPPPAAMQFPERVTVRGRRG